MTAKQTYSLEVSKSQMPTIYLHTDSSKPWLPAIFIARASEGTKPTMPAYLSALQGKLVKVMILRWQLAALGTLYYSMP
jgi:hypothetical protein